MQPKHKPDEKEELDGRNPEKEEEGLPSESWNRFMGAVKKVIQAEPEEVDRRAGESDEPEEGEGAGRS